MKKTNMRGNTDWYLKLFANFEQGVNGQSQTGIHQIRKQALADFDQMGFPTTRDEEWKYTNLKPLTEIDFAMHPAGTEKDLRPSDLNPFLIDNLDAHTFVFVNGIFNKDLSDLSDDKGELVIRPLAELLSDDQAGQYINKLTGSGSNSFTALNTAFMSDGVFLSQAKGRQLEKPVHVIYICDDRAGQTVASPRNLLIAEENSQLTFIESYGSIGRKAHFTNAVTEILIKANARVEHFRIQNENKAAFHISSTYVEQERDTRYTSHNFAFGGRLVRNNIDAALNGKGIETVLNGLYVANGEQHIDNHTTIDHKQPNCFSDELYKGVLDDTAHGVFNGKIFVRQDAQKTNAIQSNNCILLSDNAAIDTKPQLEIFADDVRCTHGATVGQLDEDAYFYLRSRGINKVKARQLLIYAFASDVVDRVNDEAIRNKLAGLLAAKLHTIRPE